MDGGGRRIQRNSNAEVKGSKPISVHPNRRINSVTGSMDEGPRMNYPLGAQRTNGASHAAPPNNCRPFPGRNRNGFSSSTATHAIQPSKTSLVDIADNGKRMRPKEGGVNVQACDRTYNYWRGISRNNTINLLEMSYRKGVSVDAADLSTRISSGSRQNIAGTQTGRRNLFTTTNIQSQQNAGTKRMMEKFLHPVQGLLDPVAKPVTGLEVRRPSLGKLAINLDRAVVCGASRRMGKPAGEETACLRNENCVTGSNLAAKGMELAMQWLPSADEIKCSISDVDMEIVAGSVADAVKAIVRSADMPSIMQIHAFRWARRLCDSDDIKHLAFTLKKEFDRNYGPAWHCIVGNSFGSFVTHSAGGFLCFSIQNVSILLFRTRVEPLQPI